MMDNLFENPIQTNSVSRLVIDKIKEAIVAGKLKPGDALPSESELMKTLGVSKTSVREAIKMLEAVGAAEIHRGNGTVLTTNPNVGYMNVLVFQLMMRQGTSREFIEFRKMFELAYTGVAIEKATPRDLECLRENVTRFEARLDSGTVTAEDDLSFHTAVLEATHNDFIISLGKAINTLFSGSIAHSVRHHPQNALDDHRKICRAICARDMDEAKRCILESLALWEQSLPAPGGTEAPLEENI